MKKNYSVPALLLILLTSIFLTNCVQPNQQDKQAEPATQTDTVLQQPIAPAPDTIVSRPQRKAPDSVGYHFVKTRKWLKANDSIFNDLEKRALILAVNRIDSASLRTLDSALMPDDLSGDIEHYFPFPFTVPGLKDIKKVIFFSYPAQAFGAYEQGELVYAGPTNMGRKKDTTPTGLFFTNWKAEETTSTFNDEWELKWNFNIENKLGVGWHQYAMPGYPASHSCLRLLEKDARYLYDWADQWIVDKANNTEKVLAQGTPVVVFGSYPFGRAKPWRKLARDPDALTITPEQLQAIADEYLAEIKKQQDRRAAQNK